MVLVKTETLQIKFPLYKNAYQSFFLRLTGSRNRIPTWVELAREGKKESGVTEWTWKRTTAEYLWAALGSEQAHKTSQRQLTEDLFAPLYAFYEEIRTNPSCLHSGNLEMKLTYQNHYIDRSASLFFQYHVTEERSNQKLTKRNIEIDVKELHARAHPTEIAYLLYNEDDGTDFCTVSEDHLQRNTIGAIQGFLQQEDANYRLQEPVLRDLYEILTEAAKIRGE